MFARKNRKLNESERGRGRYSPLRWADPCLASGPGLWALIEIDPLQYLSIQSVLSKHTCISLWLDVTASPRLALARFSSIF